MGVGVLGISIWGRDARRAVRISALFAGAALCRDSAIHRGVKPLLQPTKPKLLGVSDPLRMTARDLALAELILEARAGIGRLASLLHFQND